MGLFLQKKLLAMSRTRAPAGMLAVALRWFGRLAFPSRVRRDRPGDWGLSVPSRRMRMRKNVTADGCDNVHGGPEWERGAGRGTRGSGFGKREAGIGCRVCRGSGMEESGRGARDSGSGKKEEAVTRGVEEHWRGVSLWGRSQLESRARVGFRGRCTADYARSWQGAGGGRPRGRGRSQVASG